MKLHLIVAALVVGFLTASHAQTLGPEVAVMQIRIGKEKQRQQVVIGLYDEAAPLTVANFKELCRRNFYRGMLGLAGPPQAFQLGLVLGAGRAFRECLCLGERAAGAAVFAW